MIAYQLRHSKAQSDTLWIRATQSSVPASEPNVVKEKTWCAVFNEAHGQYKFSMAIPQGSDVQRETTGGKFPGNSRFPGNGREKFEPREFPYS